MMLMSSYGRDVSGSKLASTSQRGTAEGPAALRATRAHPRPAGWGLLALETDNVAVTGTPHRKAGNEQAEREPLPAPRTHGLPDAAPLNAPRRPWGSEGPDSPW